MKYICHSLAALNIVDGMLTYIGLNLGLIEEANPAMRAISDIELIYFLLTKLFLSALLYLIIYLDKLPENNIIKFLSSIGVIIYTFVIGLHVIWIYHTI
ncbi:DUF5658 family protein [Metabacillus endolithicus]|uniref:DUF5658 family protein n=1 Tax=Metabacillus endolithicus TaxID=1535204 RepID=A0ABW5BWZ6_9BACI